jgi:glycine/D-amino acid oxidase-like deaminating enzyme/nitrite reductase/ring-hydroxylating ferredoxin subunit
MGTPVVPCRRAGLCNVDFDRHPISRGETGVGKLEGIGEAGRADRKSYWMASAHGTDRDPLTADTEADVAIVGGGIVGLTTALLLAESGREVLVVEADRIAAGVSGYTTAKLTAGHGLLYSHLGGSFGTDAARLYAESQLAGLAFVSDLCEKRAIDCDLERQPNYVVADTEEGLEKLDAEMKASLDAGLAVRQVGDLEVVPFPAAGALVLEDQAQFHVRKYLLALAGLIMQAGGRIVEGSRVIEITGQGPYVARTAEGLVRARAVVVATHYPIVEQGFFVTRIHPHRAYVVAAPLTGNAPEGMFINTGSPTRSVRTAPLPDGRRLLLVGGEGHRVGQEQDTTGRYAVLERFMGEHFSVAETMFRWSTQDNRSVDRLPYIGRAGDEGNLYVATGFAGWGMTNGTVAALMISDDVQGKVNPWSSLYRLDRKHLLASARSFMAENTKVAAAELRGALRSGTVKSVEEIGPGHAAIVSANGSDHAVSRDPSGTLHTVSATCTHMGCTVAWNEAESTWDCPCHGSRFAADGRVLHGPALHPLKASSIGATTKTEAM